MTILPFMRISFWWSLAACTLLTDITEILAPHSEFAQTSILSSLNSSTMARLANLNGVSKTLPGIPKLPSLRRTPKRLQIIGFLSKKKDDDSQEHSVQTTRRLVLGLASIALVENTCNGVSLADDNGFWINGRIPEPSVTNSKYTKTCYSFCQIVVIGVTGFSISWYSILLKTSSLFGSKDIKKVNQTYKEKHIKNRTRYGKSWHPILISNSKEG